MAGTFVFRLHSDYGRGAFVGVDGAEDTNAGDQYGHVQLDPASLAAGEALA